MRHWLLIALLNPFTATALVCDTAETERAHREVERINQRYEDFFRYQRQLEEHTREVEAGAPQVKIQQEIREKELERARRQYRSVPKDYAREEALRIEWEKSQKDRVKQIELARLCEVQQRDAAEQILKKGRKIPELKEFDLEE